MTSSGARFEGKITLIGAEPCPPYQRPPLSKGYLLGEMSQERLLLRPEAFYADQGITLKTDCCVTAIDPETRVLSTSDGATRQASDTRLAPGNSWARRGW